MHSVALRRMSLAIVVSVIAATFSVAPNSTAAKLSHCQAPSPNGGNGPRDDRFVPFGDVKVRGITCSAALSAIHNGYLNPRFHTHGFACHVVKQYQVGTPGHGGFITGQNIRCGRRGRPGRRFWWSWST